MSRLRALRGFIAMRAALNWTPFRSLGLRVSDARARASRRERRIASPRKRAGFDTRRRVGTTRHRGNSEEESSDGARRRGKGRPDRVVHSERTLLVPCHPSSLPPLHPRRRPGLFQIDFRSDCHFYSAYCARQGRPRLPGTLGMRVSRRQKSLSSPVAPYFGATRGSQG